MTRPNSKESEERALDALGMLAFLSQEAGARTEGELEEFFEGEMSRTDLTQEEVACTGDFSFEAVLSRIRENDACAPRGELEAKPEHAAETFFAMHRGESKIAPEALEELERLRRETLGNNDEDD